MTGHQYTRVNTFGDEDGIEKVATLRFPHQRTPALRLWPWIAHAIFFTISLTTLLSTIYISRTSEARCAQQLSAYSPAVTAINYDNVKYNGSLTAPSPYRGPPGLEVDKAWTRITKAVPLFSINEDDVGKLKKNKSEIVKVPDEEGGGYLAGIEASHQLHCVNLLRMYTYFEYYKDIEPAFTDPEDVLRNHLDHCLEMLRTNLMCAADTGIITFNWVEGHKRPYPDFNTWHRCRNVNDVLDWAEERGLEWKAREKPEGAVELPEGSV